MSFPYSEDFEVVEGSQTRVTRRLADGMLFVEVWVPAQENCNWINYIGPVKLKEYMLIECVAPEAA